MNNNNNNNMVLLSCNDTNSSANVLLLLLCKAKHVLMYPSLNSNVRVFCTVLIDTIQTLTYIFFW